MRVAKLDVHNVDCGMESSFRRLRLLCRGIDGWQDGLRWPLLLAGDSDFLFYVGHGGVRWMSLGEEMVEGERPRGADEGV